MVFLGIMLGLILGMLIGACGRNNVWSSNSETPARILHRGKYYKVVCLGNGLSWEYLDAHKLVNLGPRQGDKYETIINRPNNL